MITKILKGLIIIILATGAFFLGSRIGKMPAPHDHEMAVMHEHGWYRPEDVPVTYAPPPQAYPPPGVYISDQLVRHATWLIKPRPPGLYFSHGLLGQARRPITPGLYTMQQVLGQTRRPIKPPPDVEARSAEIEEEVQRATERSDNSEVMRLTQEWIDLNAPYTSYTALSMHLQSIPQSWHYYFDDLFRAERERVFDRFAPS